MHTVSLFSVYKFLLYTVGWGVSWILLSVSLQLLITVFSYSPFSRWEARSGFAVKLFYAAEITGSVQRGYLSKGAYIPNLPRTKNCRIITVLCSSCLHESMTNCSLIFCARFSLRLMTNYSSYNQTSTFIHYCWPASVKLSLRFHFSYEQPSEFSACNIPFIHPGLTRQSRFQSAHDMVLDPTYQCSFSGTLHLSPASVFQSWLDQATARWT